jgi:hypothetical protein
MAIPSPLQHDARYPLRYLINKWRLKTKKETKKILLYYILYQSPSFKGHLRETWDLRTEEAN